MNGRHSRGRAELAILAAFAALATVLAGPASLAAQSGFVMACDEPEVVALGARDACIAAAQAAISAQPMIGLVYSGGNPNIGYSGGPRLGGTLARGSLGARVNLVQIELPDIASDQFNVSDGYLDTFGVVIPSVIVDGSLSLTEGADYSPNLGGIGALSVIGTLAFVPFPGDWDDFDQADYATGIGFRAQLLRESFTAPAVAITAMHRSMKQVSYGNICPGGPIPIANPVPGTDPPQIAGCLGPGDPGEVDFDLANWSGRFTVAKSLAGFSGLLGLGYDSFESDVNFGARSSIEVGDTTPIFRFRNLPLETSQWLVFGGISFNLFVASVTVEAGWQQGVPPLRDFDSLGSSFDPEGGTIFGSIGARVAL